MEGILKLAAKKMAVLTEGESIQTLLLQKLKLLLHLLGNTSVIVLDKLKQLGCFMVEKSGMGDHALPRFLVEKSRPLFSLLLHESEQAFRVVVEKMDEVFPAENRPQVLTVVLALACLYGCYRYAVAPVKMMKAPGKPSKLIARPAFERNPKGYFRDHRAKPSAFGAWGRCGLIIGFGAIAVVFLCN